ncbi:hypothetical protein PG994_003158 [Apiospora phragmitis]|uniref:Hydantoinase A/oxoprolinase domain-containing protein n=1 Tax=Apiospora phragmitis TaxID=2905665 RepID=A0ABR1W781_9PEZI
MSRPFLPLPQARRAVAALAKELGFNDVLDLILVGANMIKMISRGSSALADAYLTPEITRYISGFDGFQDGNLDGVLASGVVGHAQTSDDGKSPVVGFDMGGTSTDVSRFGGSFEHVFETATAGVSIQLPQLDINTVAAGGGSMLFWRDDSSSRARTAWRHPGCVENDPDGGGPRFCGRGQRVHCSRLIRALTEAAWVRVTAQHNLAMFAGAGGQHACEIAHKLGIRRIVTLALGVPSAYGMALAEVVPRRGNERFSAHEGYNQLKFTSWQANQARWFTAWPLSSKYADHRGGVRQPAILISHVVIHLADDKAQQNQPEQELVADPIRLSIFGHRFNEHCEADGPDPPED